MTPTRRLVYMLEEKIARITGESVSVGLMMPAKGYWSHRQQDVMSWQANLTVGGRHCTAGSWDNITACVRRDFEIQDQRSEDRRYVDFEAFVKERP
jgi:hypothetical protein